MSRQTSDASTTPDARPDAGLLAGPAVSDSHCHLADDAFAGDLEAVVARAAEAGLASALCILSADDVDELTRAAGVRTAWPAVHFAAGVHPHRAGAYEGRPATAVAVTREAAAAVDARALGEIGLDYHYDFAPRAVQREIFAAQVGLALELRLPVVVHTRDATDDTLAVLREAGDGLQGVMHCFTGTREDARLALDLGFLISLSGILTFPRAGALREIATFVPADRLLVETDAPFLAPVPHRGHRNEPAWVQWTLQALSEARGERPADLAAQLQRNFGAFIGTASPP